jgi:hypothetical protein
MTILDYSLKEIELKRTSHTYLSKERNEMKFVLLELIGLLCGLLMTIRPDIIWRINESWKSNDATEPSDLYLLLTRIGGICLLVIGIFTGIIVIFN